MGNQIETDLQINNMKSIVAALLALAASSDAVFWSDCVSCKADMETFFQAGMDEEVIDHQVNILVTGVCLDSEDPGGCKKGVETWWPQMNVAFNSYPDMPMYFCDALGICIEQNKIKSSLETWICEHCQDGVSAIAALFSEDANIADAVEFFNGPYFCMQENFDEATQQACIGYCTDFIPKAFPILGAAMAEESYDVCKDVWQLCQ